MAKRRLSDGTIEDIPQRELDALAAEHERLLAVSAAAQTVRRDALKAIPANTNSVPALRDEVNKLKAFIKAQFFPDDAP